MEIENIAQTKGSQEPAPNGSVKPGSNASSNHKRSLSGSILSKLSFLKPLTDESRSDEVKQDVINHSPETGETRSSELVVGLVSEQKKNRRRKGSLRKTALLGPGRMRQERRGSNLDPNRPAVTTIQRRSQTNHGKENEAEEISPISPIQSSNQPVFGFENLDSPVLRSANYTSNLPDQLASEHNDALAGTNSAAVDISTTDEDEGITFASPSHTQTVKKPGAASSDYFPPQNELLQRKRSKVGSKSPLSTLSSDLTSSADEWDYSETERWGWVVLVVTWIVFVIGMGSCFEVWSWAWDVGETPYAPPELEDDPTLPIVGYYPALIILTTVMAWVWVVIAWVGMKYFRHAKISGEET